jgi:cellulose synthase (UDP-forming)
MRNWKTRLASIFLLLATAWYLPWMFGNLNWSAPWLALPFAAASTMTAVMTLITAFNHWRSGAPEQRPVQVGQEPEVAVILPTYGERSSMVYETAKSVLEQDYPKNRIRLIISDDGHRTSIRQTVHRLSEEYPDAFVAYNEPPRRGSNERRGEAKAGNLNSVLDLINEYAPRIQFIETRDADDKVGDPEFLRQTVGQLVADPELAFVQTIKEAEVSPGDPFGNLEPLFYRNVMLARHASNAVFPCGSGLVWRREALTEIGGFPAWNLVEDLQSGVEALRRGWRGAYLPIVGAIGQTAPEDIPNVIKQRGTWALDTMRLFFWGDRRGLNARQWIQFAELGFFYLLSFAVLIFAATPVFALLFDIYPLVTNHAMYALRFWPYAVAVELLLVSLADGLSYEALWRARQMWLGMATVYARATLIALRYGPNRKPSYRVTRKEHIHAWYWKETLPQTVLLLTLVAASGYHVATRSLLTEADLGSLFWAAFFIAALSRVVVNSWHGLNPLQELGKRLRHPLVALRPKAAQTVDVNE